MIIYATQQELNMICTAASLLKIIREITAIYKAHDSIFEKWLTLPTIIYRFIVSKFCEFFRIDPAWSSLIRHRAESLQPLLLRRQSSAFMKLMKLGNVSTDLCYPILTRFQSTTANWGFQKQSQCWCEQFIWWKERPICMSSTEVHRIFGASSPCLPKKGTCHSKET